MTASFEQPESQGFRVEVPDLLLELSEPAFTSWREPSALRVPDGVDVARRPSSPATPIGSWSRRCRPRATGAEAWVLPLSESLSVAGTLDEIARVADGTEPAAEPAQHAMAVATDEGSAV